MCCDRTQLSWRVNEFDSCRAARVLNDMGSLAVLGSIDEKASEDWKSLFIDI